ncbi:MAG: S41 family peptidase [Candidatus Paceibacterota bacterium]|jgi:carboxyl-terminal processing protease
MKNFSDKIAVFLLVSVISFGFGFASKDILDSYAGGGVTANVSNQYPSSVSQDKNIDFGIFWDAWSVIEKKYTIAPLDYKKMVYGAVSGMVDSLGDPYTVFLSPAENDLFSQDMKGSFGGIGAEIGFRNGFLTVIAPLKGSPAEKAGIIAGDVIIKVDEKDITGLSIDEAIMLIRGEKGTKVNLTILRKDEEKSRDIEVVRDTVVMNTVDWKMMDGNVAYISINQFKDDTGQEFDRIIDDVLLKEPKGIVLDLRNNPGGYFNRAIDIASRFIDEGKTVVIQDGGKSKEKYTAQGGKRFDNIPVVVLVNEGSASASEILAGALKDDNDVKLVGKKTFGKGLVQEMEGLKDGSALKVTIARWLTPNGTDINHDGIHPDYEVELTEEDINNDKDPQLDKALELLK